MIKWMQPGQSMFDVTPTPGVLVVPVNCRGVAGAGLAKQFRSLYWGNYAAYKKACAQGLVRIGRPFFTVDPGRPVICNFPTKDDWRKPSELEYIQVGLLNMVTTLDSMFTPDLNVAVPALGCGKGELSWSWIQPLLEIAFGARKREFLVFPPHEQL